MIRELQLVLPWHPSVKAALTRILREAATRKLCVHSLVSQSCPEVTDVPGWGAAKDLWLPRPCRDGMRVCTISVTDDAREVAEVGGLHLGDAGAAQEVVRVHDQRPVVADVALHRGEVLLLVLNPVPLLRPFPVVRLSILVRVGLPGAPAIAVLLQHLH